MAEVRLIPVAVLLLFLLGCTSPMLPPAGRGSVVMPAGFHSATVTSLDQDWAQPVRRLERGVRLLPGLHRELVSVRTQVFAAADSRDVLLFASAKTDAGLEVATRRAFLKRAVVEAFGAELKPRFVHSRTVGGQVSHYAETTLETGGLAKLGCYAIGGDAETVWFVGAFWQPGGEDPFRMDRQLQELVGQLSPAQP